ncbi:CBS domain-containing protein [Azospirillum sp. A39]
MTTLVATVRPDTPVREVAALLLDKHITGVPVVDAAGRVVGMITENDLLHRLAARSPRRHAWWLGLFESLAGDPNEFVRVHGTRAGDVMTAGVTCVDEDTPVEEVSRILEDGKIRRVPVLRDGRLAGIVSRADLLRILAVGKPDGRPAVSVGDQALREAVMEALGRLQCVDTAYVNVVVSDGVAHLWGMSDSDAERHALKIAVEEVPGVVRVVDHLTLMRPWFVG